MTWAVGGLAALGADMVLHDVVHRTPALETRPWLVAAGVLGLAGLIQLLPSTRRSIGASGRLLGESTQGSGSPFDAGQRYGWRCVRADGPLMLVMFAAGLNLAWMVILTVVTVGERSSRRGAQLAVAVGVALLVGAAVVALHPAWLPSPFGAVR